VAPRSFGNIGARGVHKCSILVTLAAAHLIGLDFKLQQLQIQCSKATPTTQLKTQTKTCSLILHLIESLNSSKQ